MVQRGRGDPAARGQNNKILWAARVGAVEGPLQIEAALLGTGTTVTRSVDPAPGPSIIDLPSPGCWSFDLTWGHHHDRLRLGYAQADLGLRRRRRARSGVAPVRLMALGQGALG
jgi:hypothetical protein